MRGATPKVAKIFGSGLEVTDCRIVDLSAGGACLELTRAATLPKAFELVINPGAIRKRCKLVWKAGQRFGVVF